MNVDRNNIPDSYFCEQCEPRDLDAAQAKILQKRKREELAGNESISSLPLCNLNIYLNSS